MDYRPPRRQCDRSAEGPAYIAVDTEAAHELIEKETDSLNTGALLSSFDTIIVI